VDLGESPPPGRDLAEAHGLRGYGVVHLASAEAVALTTRSLWLLTATFVPLPAGLAWPPRTFRAKAQGADVFVRR
jgi:hypothetical protein